MHDTRKSRDGTTGTTAIWNQIPFTSQFDVWRSQHFECVDNVSPLLGVFLRRWCRRSWRRS